MTQLAMTFDEGARRRDVGHESALSHYCVETIFESVKRIARVKSSFTSEDILADLPAVTRESLAAFPNALGAVVRAAAKKNIIEPTGAYQAATRPEARKRRLAVWRACLSGG